MCSQVVRGQLLAGIPVLQSRDFDRTVAFFGKFGLAEIVRYDQGYLILRRDGFELHFNRRENHDPESCDHMTYVRVLSTRTLGQEFSVIEATLVDPDGNVVTFGAAHEDTGQG